MCICALLVSSFAQNYTEFESTEGVQWLSVDEDDGVAVARLKMLLEDTGIETAAFGLIVPLSIAYKRMKQGKPYKDSIDKAIDDYYKNKGASITNIDDQIKAVDTDLIYKAEIKRINALNIPQSEKKKLKLEAQAKRIDDTGLEFLGTAGKTITQEQVFQKADKLYATVFNDTLDVEEALERALAMPRDATTQADFVTFLYRKHQNAHRNLLYASLNLEM